jgi:hypothetical protein
MFVLGVVAALQLASHLHFKPFAQPWKHFLFAALSEVLLMLATCLAALTVMGVAPLVDHLGHTLLNASAPATWLWFAILCAVIGLSTISLFFAACKCGCKIFTGCRMGCKRSLKVVPAEGSSNKEATSATRESETEGGVNSKIIEADVNVKDKGKLKATKSKGNGGKVVVAAKGPGNAKEATRSPPKVANKGKSKGGIVGGENRQVESGTTCDSAEEARVAAAFAHAMVERGVRCVVFDMDQTLVAMHSRGSLARFQLPAYIASLSAACRVTIPALLAANVRVAVASFSDDLYTSGLVGFPSSTVDTDLSGRVAGVITVFTIPAHLLSYILSLFSTLYPFNSANYIILLSKIMLGESGHSSSLIFPACC